MKVIITSIELLEVQNENISSFKVIYQVGQQTYNMLAQISHQELGTRLIRTVQFSSEFWKTIEFNGVLAERMKNIIFDSYDENMPTQIPFLLGDLKEVYKQ